MILDHLTGSDFRRFRERNLFRRPRGLHHTLHVFFHMAGGAFHHIAHTVDQSDIHVNVRAQPDMCRLLGNKFGFCRRDRPAARALWHLILSPLLLVLIFHKRQHQQIHKTLDKCRFPRPHRSYHAQIDFSSRAELYIFIQVICIIL